MASGAFVIPDLAKLNLFNATDLLAANRKLLQVIDVLKKQ